MTTHRSNEGSLDERARRYRQAELDFLAQHGLTPDEHVVHAGSPPVPLRVQEIGRGHPVLFVHGTGGSGAYFAPLIRELHGLRCILLDRPGWGLSPPVDYTGQPYADLVAGLLSDTLHTLGINQAHVVGASVGSLWALRLAQVHGARVQRMVLLGGMPATPELEIPKFIRLLRSPLGRLIVRIPQNSSITRKQLAGLGHAPTLESGDMDTFVAWRVAAARDTGFLRHERAMVRAIMDRRGWKPGVALEEAEIAGIEHPTLMIYGTADPVGTTDLWRRFVDHLPRGELELVDAAGHLPWYDQPARIASRVHDFLAG